MSNSALKEWNLAMEDIYVTSIIIECLEDLGFKKDAKRLDKKLKRKYFK